MHKMAFLYIFKVTVASSPLVINSSGCPLFGSFNFHDNLLTLFVEANIRVPSYIMGKLY